MREPMTPERAKALLGALRWVPEWEPASFDADGAHGGFAEEAREVLAASVPALRAYLAQHERAERAERERDVYREAHRVATEDAEMRTAERLAAEERAQRAEAEVERLRGECARGWRECREAAAVRMESRATTEEISEQRAHDAGRYGPAREHEYAASVLRSEADTLRALQPPPAAPRPIAVGERVRVTDDGAHEGEFVGRCGYVEQIALQSVREGVLVEFDDGGLAWVAAVERVEPERSEAPHRVGDTWQDSRGEEHAVSRVESSLTGDPILFFDVGAGTPKLWAGPCGWRRVRCAETQRSDVVVLDETDDHGRPA